METRVLSWPRYRAPAEQYIYIKQRQRQTARRIMRQRLADLGSSCVVCVVSSLRGGSPGKAARRRTWQARTRRANPRSAAFGNYTDTAGVVCGSRPEQPTAEE